MAGVTTYLDPAQLPSRTQVQEVFDSFMAAFFQKLPTYGAELNSTLAAAYAALAAMNTVAAGGAYGIPYQFDSSTADADPGAGKLRLSSTTQNASTTMRIDLSGMDGNDWSSVLSSLTASTSTTKGTIRLVKFGDLSKFLLFTLTAMATPSGYRNLSVTNIGGSSPSPFANGDGLILFFERTGDVGAPGTQLRRPASITTSPTPTPDAGSTDIFTITALAENATFGAPTGTILDGQALMVRIRDNGTGRTLAWNTAYRSGSDTALPGVTTPGKWMYVGFTRNAVDGKWDLNGILDNI